MTEVLRGLYARRADLEQRITMIEDVAARAARETHLHVMDADEEILDLLLQLRSVVNQIDVYAGSEERWAHNAPGL